MATDPICGMTVGGTKRALLVFGYVKGRFSESITNSSPPSSASIPPASSLVNHHHPVMFFL